jgi:hypothetical protein
MLWKMNSAVSTLLPIHIQPQLGQNNMMYLDTEGPTGLQGGGIWRDIPEQYANEARKILDYRSGPSLIGKIASLLEEIDRLKK